MAAAVHVGELVRTIRTLLRRERLVLIERRSATRHYTLHQRLATASLACSFSRIEAPN